MTLTAQIVMRARVPCTLSELSAILEAPIASVRALAYQLRAKGRLRRLDKMVRVESRRGRNKEYLWTSV